MLHRDTLDVTLAVPAARIGDVYQFVANLYKIEKEDDTPPPITGDDTRPSTSKNAGEDDQFAPGTVMSNYCGGESEYWRPFLDELAKRPGEWVEWTALCAAIDLPPRQASGMIGAAERRCKGRPPYEKCFEDGQHWFRMPAEVADVVRQINGSNEA